MHFVVYTYFLSTSVWFCVHFHFPTSSVLASCVCIIIFVFDNAFLVYNFNRTFA